MVNCLFTWKIRGRVATPDDYTGKTVANKYRVEQMIGEGGMGKVYKATQISLDKPVVLKVLRQALLGDERTVARFKLEAKAASRLNHPNAISVLDFGQADDGAMYIAMEFVQGKDLHHILSREWPLPENRVIRLMSQVLSALSDAHSAGVIHRDLKPENIMVEQRRGDPDFVKVLDFGIAKIIDGSNDEGPALTRAGFVCGTPEYMSPEQARGAQLDHRSDLYAVGVMTYQLVAGVLPFDSDNAVGFATKHLTEIPQTPSKRRPEARVSPAMERLIMKSLAKNPDDRPQTAEQFRAELLAIDKERRATVPKSARGVSGAGPALQVPRKLTPIDQQETRVNAAPSPWSAKEDTVKAPSSFANGDTSSYSAMTASGAVPEKTAHDPRPTTANSNNRSMKLLIAALGLLLLGGIGIFAYQQFSQPRVEVPYVKPLNAPVVGGDEKLWDLALSADKRNAKDAEKAMAEGDALWHDRKTDLSLTRYLVAWQADQRPEIALKIGEIYFQKNKLEDARNWWGRVRKDAPSSSAIAYLNAVMPLQ